MYKAQERGIEVVLADTFFPSSKTCSNCNHVKEDLKLSDRTYVCPHCGAVIDRDVNAARNLEKYTDHWRKTIIHDKNAPLKKRNTSKGQFTDSRTLLHPNHSYSSSFSYDYAAGGYNTNQTRIDCTIMPSLGIR